MQAHSENGRVGDSGFLSAAVGLSPCHSAGGFVWAGAKALSLGQDESGVQRSMPGTVPRMGGWPEMLIHLWAQRGSAPLDSSLAASSQVGQEL